MFVRQIMRHPVRTIKAQTSVKAAAALMGQFNIGALPVVCAQGHPVGFLTDRDIVIRWASDAACDSSVALIMTQAVVTCRSDHTVAQAAHLMSDKQIRRLVVLDDSHKIAGILSLGDIANDVDEVLAGQTLGEIVEQR